MIRSLMTAASGMKAQQMQVDTIANNIANANTTAFKKNHLAFRSLLYQTYKEPGAPTGAGQMNPSGLQVGTGTEAAGSSKVFLQGELEANSAELSMAIQGEGFFRVKLPNGEYRYTRDGGFRRDGNGRIVTAAGYELDGAPTIGQDYVAIEISENGSLFGMKGQGDLPQQLGQISLWRFSNAAGLKAQGANMFTETISSGTAQSAKAGEKGAGIIRHRYLERSNVQIVDELVALILAQRNYEVNSRAIKASDEMLQQTNQMVR